MIWKSLIFVFDNVAIKNSKTALGFFLFVYVEGGGRAHVFDVVSKKES